MQKNIMNMLSHLNSNDNMGLSLSVFKSLYVLYLDSKADVLVSEVPVNTSNLDNISATIYGLYTNIY
jgi:hypothetical protein